MRSIHELAHQQIRHEIKTRTDSGLGADSLIAPYGLNECLSTTRGSEPSIVQLDSRDLLRNFLTRLNLKADPKLFFKVSPRDDFEVWSGDLRFLGCSAGFIRLSSYTFTELLNSDWNDLFVRSAKETAEIQTAVEALMSGAPTVDGVTDWHTVTERGGQYGVITVRVKTLSVLRDIFTDKPAGLVAIVNFKSPCELN